MLDNREYPKRPFVGVGGVVIHEGRVLIVRRKRPPLEGRWSIPGGIIEVGETLAEGVRRELLEETGIETRVHGLIELFERIERDGDGRTRYHFVIADYLCEAVGGKAQAASDASDVAWIDPSEFAKYSISEAAGRVILKAFQMARERNSAA